MECPCGSGETLARCCGPYLSGEAHAPTPEALMRSRYTAFARREVDYLVATHSHPDPEALRRQLSAGIKRQNWLKLTVHHAEQNAATGFVSFTATYIEAGRMDDLTERSEFRRRKGRWFYVKGVQE